MKECKFCRARFLIKNGYVRGKQRYKCKSCSKNQVLGDERLVYSSKVKQMAITMYVNNCGIRRIGHILNIPFQYVSNWVRDAGRIMESLISERDLSDRNISILEMDELYSYVKKSPKELEYGLLLTGTQATLLHLMSEEVR